MTRRRLVHLLPRSTRTQMCELGLHDPRISSLDARNQLLRPTPRPIPPSLVSTKDARRKFRASKPRYLPLIQSASSLLRGDNQGRPLDASLTIHNGTGATRVAQVLVGIVSIVLAPPSSHCSFRLFDFEPHPLRSHLYPHLSLRVIDPLTIHHNAQTRRRSRRPWSALSPRSLVCDDVPPPSSCHVFVLAIPPTTLRLCSSTSVVALLSSPLQFLNPILFDPIFIRTSLSMSSTPTLAPSFPSYHSLVITLAQSQSQPQPRLCPHPLPTSTPIPTPT
ncbi:hypothetical protein BDN70DRAFT_936090 [Pholiota conissans]|uniref:Uncharacterized protein n=1 Tax=Pholiota conissans TaxID=109636 RepID=A0A9P5YSR4_9AGAR|nr:hypothetical protein BDN70DRAFT_936090 [Pholiota conissans]